MSRMKLFPLFLVILMLLSACGTKQMNSSESAKVDYDRIKSLIDNDTYDEADRSLGRFIVDYPYSEYLINAKLMRVYTSYKRGNLEVTQGLAERFIKRHPRHADLAYAQYMLAMSYYKKRAEQNREQAPTLKAIAAFEILIKNYPTSPYVASAKPRLQALRNTLAGHELAVGKFYYEQSRFVAAVNRLQVVLSSYQRSPAIEESLYYLAASYAALDMKKNAHETAVLLRHNYPKSSWANKVDDFL